MSSSISSLTQAGVKPQAPAKKTALVVDDSKLARYVLKEMLLEQGLKVETADSAEEALGILSAFKPDVIFMDHMMPGMDGFQAVQAIKSDPSTAKIPIMMYTSKDEGVYINQARALGAVGVLPKKLKPMQLESVLQQLKLIPQAANQSAVKPVSSESSDAEKNQAHIIANTRHSLDELARSASEDLEKDSMRQLFRQLFIEQRDTIKQDQNSLLQQMVSEVGPAIGELSERNVRWQKIIILVAVLAVSLVVFFDFNKKEQNDLVILQDALDEQSQILSELKNSVSNASVETIDTYGSVPLMDVTTLEWALNQNNQVAYQQGLNTQKYQSYLFELLARLNDQSFQGSLTIKFHEGNFCELKGAGTSILLDGKKSVMECHSSSEYETGLSEDFQGFESFVRSLDEQYQGIDIAVIEMGVEYTLEDYPVPSQAVASREWNRVASMNRRLEYELTP